MRTFKTWRVPLGFLLIWTIIFAVPRLRALSLYQISTDAEAQRAKEFLQDQTPLFQTDYKRYREASTAFVARFPNDSRVQIWNVWPDTFEDLEKYEPILQRFPDEAWLPVKYLMRVCSMFRTGRGAGALYSRPLVEKPANMTAAQIKSALKVCERGAKLEPQNCFWDMMRALLLFGARRDVEAVRALQTGSHKSFYNDHSFEINRKRIEADNLFRPQLVEEKCIAINCVLLPQLGKMREVARLATWKAVQQQRQGKWKDALTLRADIARVGTLMRDQNELAILTTSGINNQNTAYRAGDKIYPDRLVKLEHIIRLSASHFAKLCRQHQQFALAQETERQAKISIQIAKRLEPLITNPYILAGVENNQWKKLLALNWMGASLVFQLLLAFPVWCVMTALVWRKRTTIESSETKTALRVWQIVTAICAMTALVATYLGAGRATWDVLTLIGIEKPKTGWIVSILRWIVTLGPIFLGALVCGLLGRRQQKQQKLHSDQNLSSSDDMQHKYRSVGLVLCFLVASSIGAGLWGFYQGATLWHFTIYVFWNDPLLWLIDFLLSPWFVLNVLTFALVYWTFFNLSLASEQKRAAAIANLRIYQRSLSLTLIYGSTLYLFLLFFSLQLRHSIEIAADNYLQKGEMSILKASWQTAKGEKKT